MCRAACLCDRWHVNKVQVSLLLPTLTPVNLNPRIVYKHMGAVLMCWDWDPDPPNFLESDKVTFFALNYIIVIS